MKHVDYSPAFPVPSHHLAEQHRHGLRIDRSEWLVEQNNCTILQNQAREQRSLKFAHRDFANRTLQPSSQSHRLRHRRRARTQRGPWGAEGTEFSPPAERDQLRYCERVVAVDRRKLRQIGQSLPRCTTHHPASQSYHARDRRQERALAGPVSPNNGGQTARNELSANGLQRYSPPKTHGYVAQQNAALSLHVSNGANHSPPHLVCRASQGPRHQPQTAWRGEGGIISLVTSF